MGALISLATPYFLAVDNLMGVFRSFSLTAIMAIGMVMVIITGGIDLSVGSVLGFSSLMTAFAFVHGFSTPVAIASGLLSGLAFGISNGISHHLDRSASVHCDFGIAEHRPRRHLYDYAR